MGGAGDVEEEAIGHGWQAGKGGVPGKPIAKSPKGTVTTTRPTFKWSKVSGATRYELRVYQGRKQLLEKTGLGKNRRSWKSSMALPVTTAISIGFTMAAFVLLVLGRGSALLDSPGKDGNSRKPTPDHRGSSEEGRSPG